MTETIFDLRGAIRAIYRRRLVVVSLMLLGAVGGMTLTRLIKPAFAAHAQVLLPPAARNAQGLPLRDPATEALVATNREVLERAGMRLTPPLGAAVLRERTSAKAVSLDVVDIQAKGESAADAAVVANAVAEEYADYANTTLAAESEARIKDLEDQRAGLQAQLSDVETRIAAANAAVGNLPLGSGPQLSAIALGDSLRGEQSQFKALINGLSTRIGDARLDAELNRRGTRVLDQASAPRRTGVRPVIVTAALGMLGLVVGILVALGLAQGDKRLRRRRDVAEAVGAPILASLRVRRRRPGRAKELLAGWLPTGIEQSVLRNGFGQLGPGASDRIPPQVLVVTLAGDSTGFLLGCRLAVFAARSGAPTALAIDNGAGRRLGLHEGTHATCPNLSIHLIDEEGGVVADRGRLVITVVEVEPGPIIAPDVPVGTVTVLALSAGFATLDVLSSTAAACAEARFPLRGIFLANPDPSDGTTGLLTAALHPARDTRFGPWDPGDAAGTTSSDPRGSWSRRA